MPTEIPCSDCGDTFPSVELKATLVGDLCPDCRLRFENAATFLANMKTSTGIFAEVKECLRMYRDVTSVRSDRPKEAA
jgi:hypothetical protein